MLYLTHNCAPTAFHVTYTPAPLDVFYMRGPWLTWLRASVVALTVE